MTKTPYELRLEVLRMAQEQANQKYFQQWEQAARKAEISESAKFLSEVPEFPTSEDILLEAEKFKRFVDKS